MLAGTGLTYRFLDEHTVAVTPAPGSSGSAQGLGAARGLDLDESGVRCARFDQQVVSADSTHGDPARYAVASSAGDQVGPSGPATVSDPGSGAEAAPAETGPAEVIVTSTRVQRAGYSAPTPVTSVSSKDLDTQAPSTVADVLAQLPSFRQDSSPTTTGVNSLNGGESTADLRGLGAPRTLVLVNGQRFVPAASDGTVDLNQIPTLLISRIDVVTGGASAAYGSDAVSGVVNFILDNHFEGFKSNFEYGESKYSDDIEKQGAIAFGTSAMDGKLHFMFGADYISNEGIGDQDTRPWGQKDVGLITNTGYGSNGLPNYIISPNVHTSTLSNGGLIVGATKVGGGTSTALNGTAFGPGGAPYQFQYGTVYGTSMIGGEQGRPNPTLNSELAKPFDTLSGLSRIEYEFTPELTAYVELSAAREGAGGYSQQARDTGVAIQADNAYLPASIRSAMATDGLSSITLGRYYDDTGAIQLNSIDKTYRVIGGLQGSFDLLGHWKWDANYQYGRNTYDLTFGANNRNQANFLEAVDAVINPSTGSIVCRSTLTSPHNGCIPVDILGDGSETLNSFVNGSATYHLLTQQSVADVDLNGEPFSDWAGPVSIASGYEFRRETGLGVADPVSTQMNANGSTGGWALGNQQNFEGSYNVNEGYLETVVPMVGDDGFGIVRSIDINAAARATDYSTSGYVTTWKGGFNWQPFKDLRIRGTRSHDVRAPNLSELFIGGTGSSYTPVFDKVLNETVQVRQAATGNLALKPEQSETWTGGFVYQPSWAHGFATSIDYYKISIKDVISTIGAPTLVSGCNSGNTLYCQSIVYNPNGTINYVNSQPLNLNEMLTSGVDIESSYSIAASDIVKGLRGNLTIHALASFVDELTTVLPGNLVQNVIGQVSQFDRLNGVPKWRGNLDFTYDLAPWSMNVRMRYVGQGVYAYNLIDGSGAANTIADNHVGGLAYFDVGGSYGFSMSGRYLQFYARVENLLDKDPPFIPSGAAGGVNESSTNAAFYDTIGRYFKVGVRMSF